MSQRKYFGTDGIRGTVGQEPITPQFMLRLGFAVGKVMADSGNPQGKNPGERRAVLIGKDTRISGYMMESALEAGLSAAGADIRLLGPLPTPGIAYLTRTMHGAAGLVISASHNAYPDNGVKFFSAAGEKLADAQEAAIEQCLDEPMQTVAADRLGKAQRIDDAQGRYVEFCKSTWPRSLNLDGIKLVLDCAHGATYHVAPRVFAELGARVVAIGTRPDGLNINAQRGSTQPEAMCAAVVESGADLGIAFDGDGDRVIMATGSGRIVDGDELLYLIARSRQQAGNLRGGVAGTVMTNLGIERALRALDIEFARTQVGDRHVHQHLERHDWQLGGESSGHIICRDLTTTGDAIVTALQVLAGLVRDGQTLASALEGVSKYPQVMINVPVAGKINLQAASIAQAVKNSERKLGDAGRVILRASGTEPVVRVTVEGESEPLIQQQAEQIAAAVTACAG